MNHITTLVLQENRDIQHGKLFKIMQEALRLGYEIVVIRINPTVKERQTFNEENIIKASGIMIIGCSCSDELNKLVDFVEAIKFWHISKIQFLFGKAGFFRRMCESELSARLKLKDLQNNTYIKAYGEFLIGGIDPLDDDLNISGTEAMEDIVAKVNQQNAG